MMNMEKLVGTKSRSNSIRPIGIEGDSGIITVQPSKDKNEKFILPDVPEGLESLKETQHLFIKQSGLPIEIFQSMETHYEVLNSNGEKIFMADETTDTSTRAWCRGTKPFDVSVFIRSGLYRKEVMKMDGEPRSCGCGGDITLRLTNCTLGTIEQGTDCSIPVYSVMDYEGQEILQIVGPPSKSCFSFRVVGIAEFDIMNLEGTRVGKIAKYWGGKEKEILLKSDIWGVKFPLEMKVSTKALLLACCFLLNFHYQDNL